MAVACEITADTLRAALPSDLRARIAEKVAAGLLRRFTADFGYWDFRLPEVPARDGVRLTLRVGALGGALELELELIPHRGKAGIWRETWLEPDEVDYAAWLAEVRDKGVEAVAEGVALAVLGALDRTLERHGGDIEQALKDGAPLALGGDWERSDPAHPRLAIPLEYAVYGERLRGSEVRVECGPRDDEAEARLSCPYVEDMWIQALVTPRGVRTRFTPDAEPYPALVAQPVTRHCFRDRRPFAEVVEEVEAMVPGEIYLCRGHRRRFGAVRPDVPGLCGGGE